MAAMRWQGMEARGVSGDSDMSCVLRVLMPGVFRRAAAAAACCAACTSRASSAAATAMPSGCSIAIACKDTILSCQGHFFIDMSLISGSASPSSDTQVSKQGAAGQ